MAEITDYASLQTALGDWLIRSDISTSYIGYFIQIAEERIYNDVFTLNEGRGLRVMESALTGITATTSTALPSDYLGLKSARVVSSTDQWPLQRKSLEYIYANYPDRSSVDVPSFISVENGNFIFGAPPDSDYQITGVYWARSAALSSTNTTTWMTANIPATLLAACLAAAFQFIQNEEQAQVWAQAYQTGLQGYLMRDKAEEWSGSALAMAAA